MLHASTYKSFFFINEFHLWILREFALMNVDLLQSVMNPEKIGKFNFDFSKGNKKVGFWIRSSDH